MEPDSRSGPRADPDAFPNTALDDLEGEWRVERVDGLLPPMAGVWKRIVGEDGTTHVGPLPGWPFCVHRREQAKVYLVLSGGGRVRVDGEKTPIEVGSAVFIPGDAVHSCENTGASELRVVYVLAADSFEDVDYVLED